MPPTKVKPSDIAVEAKRHYIPYIEKNYPELPARSYVHSQLDRLPGPLFKKNDGPKKLRVAVLPGDPVDVALNWNHEESTGKGQSSSGGISGEPHIPLVVPVDERKAGGDWETASMAPEENLSRRSNFVRCLNDPSLSPNQKHTYPLPLKGGVYSPRVVVFRSGPEAGYGVWSDFRWLPVISVAPVRRPKLDGSGQNYSFEKEKELMKEKIRTVLRIAAAWQHRDLCIGAFGAGHGFKNPVHQLAAMWRDVLFSEEEFQDAFTNIVFVIDGSPDFDVFKAVFDPANLCKTSYMR